MVFSDQSPLELVLVLAPELVRFPAPELARVLVLAPALELELELVLQNDLRRTYLIQR